ncbi:uncharacterized [Tachysurus ichikawai]
MAGGLALGSAPWPITLQQGEERREADAYLMAMRRWKEDHSLLAGGLRELKKNKSNRFFQKEGTVACYVRKKGSSPVKPLSDPLNQPSNVVFTASRTVV